MGNPEGLPTPLTTLVIVGNHIFSHEDEVSYQTVQYPNYRKRTNEVATLLRWVVRTQRNPNLGFVEIDVGLANYHPVYSLSNLALALPLNLFGLRFHPKPRFVA